MIEILCALLSGAYRRLDGMEKTTWGVWRHISAFLTRIMPIILAYTCLHMLYPIVPWVDATSAALCALYVVFGVIISASLQRRMGGWEFFNLRRITHHWHAMLAYAGLAYFHPLLAVLGIAGCLLAGLTHPVLTYVDKHIFKMSCHTCWAEFLVGFFILVPFAVYSLIGEIGYVF